MAQKDEQDFYNEVAKFVRGEDHDIKSGTIEMIQAVIACAGIAQSNIIPTPASRRMMP